METSDLKKAGLKATHPRIKILQILEGSDARHMGAEDVYKALLETGEDVGLATVYRVLTQFEAAGLVARHHFEGGHSVFELNQGDHHDHILCVKCGRVDEFIDDVYRAPPAGNRGQGRLHHDGPQSLYLWCLHRVPG